MNAFCIFNTTCRWWELWELSKEDENGNTGPTNGRELVNNFNEGWKLNSVDTFRHLEILKNTNIFVACKRLSAISLISKLLVTTIKGIDYGRFHLAMKAQKL